MHEFISVRRVADGSISRRLYRLISRAIQPLQKTEVDEILASGVMVIHHPAPLPALTTCTNDRYNYPGIRHQPPLLLTC